MARLEDIGDIIEDLPRNLMNMLTHIGELDFDLQNALNNKLIEAEQFFHSAEKMQPTDRESVYQALVMDLYTIAQDADLKIDIADQLLELVLTRMEHLDRQMADFKNNLETFNPGITTTIEAKVAEEAEKACTEAKATKSRKDSKRKKLTQSKKKSSASKSTALRIDKVPVIVVKQEEEVNDLPIEVDVTGETASSGTANLTFDTTRYCICNEVSYGKMVACDNKSCTREWFHYDCVGLIGEPMDNWQCPMCRPNDN